MKLTLGFLALVAVAFAQPVVTAVVDAGAYTPDIARGSVFVVKGTGLSAVGIVSATAPTYPAALNNVRITLTAATGGAVVNGLMVYTYNSAGVNQLAAVLPSTAVAGAYDLRVENGSATSAPFRMNVVARKPGIVTASSDGSGPAQATINGELILQRTTNVGAIDRFTTRAVRPGERVDLWGTGIGADAASDTGGTSGDQTAAGTIRVFVNGNEVTPAYAGRSQGFPGLDQVVFTLPTATPLNCAVTIQVRAGDVFSNPVTIATGATDTCPANAIRINEIESNGGTPGDWVELYNPGTAAVDISGYRFKDNDDSRTFAVAAGTSVPAGGYYLLEEAAFSFGLGTPDSARLYNAAGTLVDTYSWTPHATSTYGRCPSGSGAFATTTTSTKGAANDCGVLPPAVKINEVESNGGTPGDWVELYNAGTTTVNIGGYIFRDSEDTRNYAIPTGTTIAPGAYYLLEEAAFNFGLGAADSARIFDTTGAIADSYSWTAHATTTYGRCPNGVGGFTTTVSSTKGASNDCGATVSTIKINEVESNGGTPGDWFELINTGTSAVNIAGWKMLDNDDTHTSYTFPTGTTIAPGAHLVVEEAQFGFGLGAPDSVRIFDANGTLYETYSWTTHAALTYGRCPNGTGSLTNTNSSTKGAANDCSSPVKINEVESDGGTPGDWVELYNPTNVPVNIAGFVFKDSDDSRNYAIPAGTTIPAEGYYILEEAAFNFGLGSADSARLYDPAGALIDTYTWTAHATTSYGRCPNGTGTLTTTQAVTKGTVNNCPGDVNFAAWPGGTAVQFVDGTGAFPTNMSGLIYEGTAAAPGVLWAARNGIGAIFRLVFNGNIWTPDTANDWGSGKILRYPNGTGDPDTEGLTIGGTTSSAGMYTIAERNNNANSVSRNSILRFDPSAAGSSLTATNEWNITSDILSTGANLGLEDIAWIPDTFLTSRAFFDESKNRAYNPADYPNHAAGLFFVAVEANGAVYGYALNHTDNTFTKVASITSSFPSVMALSFDRDTNDFWVVCDDTCQGRSVVMRIDQTTGKFAIAQRYARPTGMPNINNEGFAVGTAAQCSGGVKPVFWADDSATDGHAIRSGTLSCSLP